ncbi:collagen alpha-1(I) chain-like [Homarus americanus]|uniref:collagen alpha-1(I) chain-like n=1 Tax=Homarus americanus TaxID=6706 RepID=UPI001C469AF3|nr:collagen alpha-1(I) chain-like [Homarus americanus]
MQTGPDSATWGAAICPTRYSALSGSPRSVGAPRGPPRGDGSSEDPSNGDCALRGLPKGSGTLGILPETAAPKGHFQGRQCPGGPTEGYTASPGPSREPLRVLRLSRSHLGAVSLYGVSRDIILLLGPPRGGGVPMGPSRRPPGVVTPQGPSHGAVSRGSVPSPREPSEAVSPLFATENSVAPGDHPQAVTSQGRFRGSSAHRGPASAKTTTPRKAFPRTVLPGACILPYQVQRPQRLSQGCPALPGAPPGATDLLMILPTAAPQGACPRQWHPQYPTRDRGAQGLSRVQQRPGPYQGRRHPRAFPGTSPVLGTQGPFLGAVLHLCGLSRGHHPSTGYLPGRVPQGLPRIAFQGAWGCGPLSGAVSPVWTLPGDIIHPGTYPETVDNYYRGPAICPTMYSALSSSPRVSALPEALPGATDIQDLPTAAAPQGACQRQWHPRYLPETAAPKGPFRTAAPQNFWGLQHPRAFPGPSQWCWGSQTSLPGGSVVIWTLQGHHPPQRTTQRRWSPHGPSQGQLRSQWPLLGSAPPQGPSSSGGSFTSLTESGVPPGETSQGGDAPEAFPSTHCPTGTVLPGALPFALPGTALSAALPGVGAPRGLPGATDLLMILPTAAALQRPAQMQWHPQYPTRDRGAPKGFFQGRQCPQGPTRDERHPQGLPRDVSRVLENPGPLPRGGVASMDSPGHHHLPGCPTGQCYLGPLPFALPGTASSAALPGVSALPEASQATDIPRILPTAAAPPGACPKAVAPSVSYQRPRRPKGPFQGRRRPQGPTRDCGVPRAFPGAVSVVLGLPGPLPRGGVVCMDSPGDIIHPSGPPRGGGVPTGPPRDSRAPSGPARVAPPQGSFQRRWLLHESRTSDWVPALPEALPQATDLQDPSTAAAPQGLPKGSGTAVSYQRLRRPKRLFRTAAPRGLPGTAASPGPSQETSEECWGTQGPFLGAVLHLTLPGTSSSPGYLPEAVASPGPSQGPFQGCWGSQGRFLGSVTCMDFFGTSSTPGDLPRDGGQCYLGPRITTRYSALTGSLPGCGAQRPSRAGFHDPSNGDCTQGPAQRQWHLGILPETAEPKGPFRGAAPQSPSQGLQRPQSLPRGRLRGAGAPGRFLGAVSPVWSLPGISSSSRDLPEAVESPRALAGTAAPPVALLGSAPSQGSSSGGGSCTSPEQAILPPGDLPGVVTPPEDFPSTH